jgi:hypothetical protein
MRAEAREEDEMNTSKRLPKPSLRRSRLLSWCVVPAAAVPLLLSPPLWADSVMPPPVPANIQVPAGNHAFLEGHAVGTQNYICLPSGSGFAWTFFGPQATLLNDNDAPIIFHFLSPNPSESGTPRATWQHARNGSTVWAKAIDTSTDPAFVAAGAIPWLLLQPVGSESGPTGGDTLTKTTFIQRLDTSGGVAPPSGCAQSADVGKKAFVPYTANYFFYKAHMGE